MSDGNEIATMTHAAPQRWNSSATVMMIACQGVDLSWAATLSDVSIGRRSDSEIAERIPRGSFGMKPSRLSRRYRETGCQFGPPRFFSYRARERQKSECRSPIDADANKIFAHE